MSKRQLIIMKGWTLARGGGAVKSAVGRRRWVGEGSPRRFVIEVLTGGAGIECSAFFVGARSREGWSLVRTTDGPR
ncbi:hypothetical protein ACFVX3_31675 [Rhodococcus erythropolis]